MSHADVIIDMSYTTILSGTFKDVRDAGISGVIHKAGTGLDKPDQAYFERRYDAFQAGLLWGAYHVGIKTCNGTEQADAFMDKVRSGAPTGKTLLALDFERNEMNMTKSMLPKQAGEFAQRIREAVGFYPVVYGRGTLIKAVAEHPDSPLCQCPLWLAHHGEDVPAAPAGWDRWTIWQYTEHGSVGRAILHCDRNRFNGTAEELAAFWQAHSI
jgi:lysozyme